MCSLNNHDAVNVGVPEQGQSTTQPHPGVNVDAVITVLDNIDEAVYVADPVTYELLFVNQMLISLFGRINGRKCYQYLQQLDTPCSFCTNCHIFGPAAGKTYIWEFQNKTNHRWYKCVDKAISWYDGRLVRMEIAIDITDRKEVEEAIRVSEERLRFISDNLPGGLVFQLKFDSSGASRNFTYLSGKLEELHEISLPTAIADAAWFYAQIHPDDRQLLLAAEQRAIATMQPMVVEVRFLLPSGGERWRFISSAPLRSPDGSIVFNGVELDNTDRKQAEDESKTLREKLLQAQKLETVGRLAGGIAHDFNNMLSVILGHAELGLQKIPASHPLQENLGRIVDASQRSADLIRQLLAFARQQTITPRLLNLNEVVAGMLQMLTRLIGEDISLKWVPGKNIGLVLMDPSQIDQILSNLFVNARAAITKTGGIVTVETGDVELDADQCRAHPELSPGQYVLLAVSDNGCGMDKAMQSRIFEPFYTTKGVGMGTGLGLATVYGIVKQNNGIINVYSELGRGSTFRIYFPGCKDVGTAPALSVTKERQIPLHPDGKTLLLVEDDPLICEVTEQMLTCLGYETLVARTPGEALRSAKGHVGTIDLLLTDVVMPEKNGVELAKDLKVLFPNIKCLFMSGYAANVIVHHGVVDPGVHFLQKPFSKDALAQKLQHLLLPG